MKLMSAAENTSFTKYYLVNYPSLSCCDILHFLTQNVAVKTTSVLCDNMTTLVLIPSQIILKSIYPCPIYGTYNFVKPECDNPLVNSDPYLPRMAARCLLPSALIGSLVTLSTSLFLHIRSSWNSCDIYVKNMYLCTFCSTVDLMCQLVNC